MSAEHHGHGRHVAPTEDKLSEVLAAEQLVQREDRSEVGASDGH